MYIHVRMWSPWSSETPNPVETIHFFCTKGTNGGRSPKITCQIKPRTLAFQVTSSPSNGAPNLRLSMAAPKLQGPVTSIAQRLYV